MAKASVQMTCSECGGTYIAQKTCRNRTEADNFEKYMESVKYGTCPTCYAEHKKMERDAERSRASAEAAEYAQKNGWATLEGTEKQISWAETLRYEAQQLIVVNARRCTYRGEVISRDNAEEIIEDIKTFFATENSAKLFIDNQDYSQQKWLDHIALYIMQRAEDAPRKEQG